jgi:hypothetical protein
MIASYFSPSPFAQEKRHPDYVSRRRANGPSFRPWHCPPHELLSFEKIHCFARKRAQLNIEEGTIYCSADHTLASNKREGSVSTRKPNPSP